MWTSVQSVTFMSVSCSAWMSFRVFHLQSQLGISLRLCFVYCRSLPIFPRAVLLSYKPAAGFEPQPNALLCLSLAISIEHSILIVLLWLQKCLLQLGWDLGFNHPTGKFVFFYTCSWIRTSAEWLTKYEVSTACLEMAIHRYTQIQGIPEFRVQQSPKPQASTSAMIKSSSWAIHGLEKVLQLLLRPRYRSPSSHRPNAPLWTKQTKNNQLCFLENTFSQLFTLALCLLHNFCCLFPPTGTNVLLYPVNFLVANYLIFEIKKVASPLGDPSDFCLFNPPKLKR